jgi:hypothetical protein
MNGGFSFNDSANSEVWLTIKIAISKSRKLSVLKREDVVNDREPRTADDKTMTSPRLVTSYELVRDCRISQVTIVCDQRL